MSDFEYEVLQKKRLARQAQYRKNGSKSKKCSLSTDYMTRSQWKRKCGEVMTYNLGQPMEWKAFKALPERIQKEYLSKLIDTYKASATDLARMFHVTSQTVINFCAKESIGINFPRGGRKSKEIKDAFDKFLRDEVTSENITSETAENDPVNVPVAEEQPTMALRELSVSLSGKFNQEMIYNSICSMVPKGTIVNVDIKVQLV